MTMVLQCCHTLSKVNPADDRVKPEHNHGKIKWITLMSTE